MLAQYNNNNNDKKERKFRQIMMSGSRIKFDEGYVTVNKFSNANVAQTTVYHEYVYC